MTKVGSGHVNIDQARSLEDALYADMMAKELSSIPRQKPSVPTEFNGKPIAELTSVEKEEFHLSLQPQSTQRLIKEQKTRDPKDDLDWVLRPLPPCIANVDAKTKEELIGERSLNATEAIVYKGMQRREKNTLGDSDKSSVNSEKREKGIQAFTYSKPAELTLQEIKKVTKLEEIKSTPLEPESPKKKGFFSKVEKYLPNIPKWLKHGGSTFEGD